MGRPVTRVRSRSTTTATTVRRTTGRSPVTAGTTSSAITGIPTGTQCTISETPPTAPTGYTFGDAVVLAVATVTITNKDQTVNVQTTNTLTRDTGSLTLSKVLTRVGRPVAGCVHDQLRLQRRFGAHGSKSVTAGTTSSAITGIPTGTQCSISETPPRPRHGLHVRRSVVLAVRDGNDHDEGSDGRRADRRTR